MRCIFGFRLALPLVALLGLLVATETATARNVPGSAAAATQELIERAGTDLADLILDALDGTGSGGVGVTQDADGNTTFSSMGGSRMTADGFVAGGALSYRDIDRSGEIEGDLITGALSLGQRLDGGALVFGSILFEGVDVETPYNSGTIDNSGVGVALGIRSSMANGFDLSAMVAAMWLDYDVSRSGGAITGSYDATRWFLDVRASNLASLGTAEIDYNFGLRHVRQSDDAYTETGGGPVASADYSSTSVFLNTRTYFGQGPVTPYLQGDVRYVAGNGSNLPGIGSDDGDGFVGYAGLGLRGANHGTDYDAGFGAHFDDDGYTGASARLSVSFRF